MSCPDEDLSCCDQLDHEDDFDTDDGMDGDHASGLALAGFGLDEDYSFGGCDDCGDW